MNLVFYFPIFFCFKSSRHNYASLVLMILLSWILFRFNCPLLRTIIFLCILMDAKNAYLCLFLSHIFSHSLSSTCLTSPLFTIYKMFT